MEILNETKDYKITANINEWCDSELDDWLADPLARGYYLIMTGGYTLDKHPYGELDSKEMLQEVINDNNIVWKAPLLVYEHSTFSFMIGAKNGYPISSVDNPAPYPFNCRWDAGVRGFAFITQESLKESKRTIQQITEGFEKDMIVLRDVFNGWIYDLRLIEKKSGEVIDSTTALSHWIDEDMKGLIEDMNDRQEQENIKQAAIIAFAKSYGLPITTNQQEK